MNTFLENNEGLILFIFVLILILLIILIISAKNYLKFIEIINSKKIIPKGFNFNKFECSETDCPINCTFRTEIGNEECPFKLIKS